MSNFEALTTPYVCAIVNEKNTHARMQIATSWLYDWLKFQKKCKQVGTVIFDIDDTLIYLNEKTDKEIQIGDICKIFHLCETLGFDRHIVTARPESTDNREYTEDMLKKKGLHRYKKLYMMPSSYKKTTEGISTYKYNSRCLIAVKHRIIANIGDMWHDHMRFPLCKTMSTIDDLSDTECAILFPTDEFGQVSLKVSGRT